MGGCRFGHPRVEAAQAPGLQVFRFESQGLTMRETIDGAPYVGQRFEFAVFPRRAGALTIPPVTVRLMDRSGDETGKLSGQPTMLAVAAPPGVDPSRPAIGSTRVTLSESWEPADAKQIEVGDALVRVVRRTAEDTPSLGFSPIDLSAPEGVRVYSDQPQVNDKVERGRLTGERTDRITYVFEKPGDYALPAVSQVWWDLSAHALKRTVGDGRRVAVAAVAVPGDARSGTSPRLGWRGLAAIGGGVLILLALAALAAAKLVAAAGRRRAQAPSEAALFAKAKEAARGGDPAAAYRALVTWRDSARLPAEALTSLPPVQALERRLFAGAKEWRGEELGPALECFRRDWLAGRVRRGDSDVLPPLNPATRALG